MSNINDQFLQHHSNAGRQCLMLSTYVYVCPVNAPTTLSHFLLQGQELLPYFSLQEPLVQTNFIDTKRFGGCDSALVVACGPTRYTCLQYIAGIRPQTAHRARNASKMQRKNIGNTL